MIQFFGAGLCSGLVCFLGRRRFTNNLEAMIRDVIMLLSGHFPGAADAKDQKKLRRKKS